MKNIYVGNLSFQTTTEELEAAFGAYGQVESVNIIRDRDTGQSRGFAFIEMAVDSEADTAINTLNGADLGGRPLKVTEARPREERAGGGGGGGGFNRGPRPGGGGGGGGRRPGGGGGRPGGGGGRREPRW